MADFYEDMRKMASSLLASTSAGGLGQGDIKLVHMKPGDIDPGSPYDPVEPKEEVTQLQGVARGVGKELIGTEHGGPVIMGSNKIMSSDRVVTCAATDAAYAPGDTLLIDGKPVHILSYTRIPAAGIIAALKFIVRG